MLNAAEYISFSRNDFYTFMHRAFLELNPTAPSRTIGTSSWSRRSWKPAGVGKSIGSSSTCHRDLLNRTRPR